MGLPVPPSIEIMAANPYAVDRFQELLYGFKFDFEANWRALVSFIDDYQGVRVDMTCAFKESSIQVLGYESDKMGMNERSSIMRGCLAEIMGKDVRRFRQGRVEVAIIPEELEESCAVKFSPFGIKRFNDALEEMKRVETGEP